MIVPSLSIITPSYNQGEFIEDNIMSIKNQLEYANIEHIVVDGGSDDETINILQKHEDDYNLRWVSEPDQGQSHAINKGIKMAEADWIGWQNSDDFYLPNAFERFSQAVDSNPSSDLIYGDLLIVDDNGQTVSRKYSTHPDPFIQKYWSHFTSNQCLFLNRRVFDMIGDINEDLSYNMDGDLFWRIVQQDLQSTHIPYFVGAIRVHESAKTQGEITDKQKQESQMIYPISIYDCVFPAIALKTSARLKKALYLLRDGRREAIRWNIKCIFENIK